MSKDIIEITTIAQKLPEPFNEMILAFESVRMIPVDVFRIIISYLDAEDIYNFSASPDFFEKITGNTEIQERLRLYCIASDKFSKEQKEHLASPHFQLKLIHKLTTVQEAFELTSDDRVAPIIRKYNYAYAGLNHRLEAVSLGYIPNEVRDDWFDHVHLEVLKRESEREKLLLIKYLLENLIELENPKNKKTEDLSAVGLLKDQKSTFQTRMRDLSNSIYDQIKEIKEKTEAEQTGTAVSTAPKGEIYKKPHEIEIVPDIYDPQWSRVAQINEEEAKRTAEQIADTKKAAEQEKTKVEEKTQLEKLIAELDKVIKKLNEWDLVLTLDTIRGLNSEQVKALKLGLSVNQVKRNVIEKSLLDIIEKWKKEGKGIKAIQAAFENIKKYNTMQRLGLNMGFTEQDVTALWFSNKHIDAISKGFAPEQVKDLDDVRVEMLMTKRVKRQALLAYKGAITYEQHQTFKKGYAFEEVAGLNAQELAILEQGVNHRKIRGAKYQLTYPHIDALKIGYDFDEISDLSSYQTEILLLGIRKDKILALKKDLGYLQKELIKKHPALFDEIVNLEIQHHHYKLIEFGYDFKTAMACKVELSNSQLELLSEKRFSLDEIKDLNEIEVELLKLGIDRKWIIELKIVPTLYDSMRCGTNQPPFLEFFTKKKPSSFEELRDVISLNSKEAIELYYLKCNIKTIKEVRYICKDHVEMVRKGIPLETIKDLWFRSFELMQKFKLNIEQVKKLSKSQETCMYEHGLSYEQVMSQKFHNEMERLLKDYSYSELCDLTEHQHGVLVELNNRSFMPIDKVKPYKQLAPIHRLALQARMEYEAIKDKDGKEVWEMMIGAGEVLRHSDALVFSAAANDINGNNAVKAPTESSAKQGKSLTH